MQSLKESLQINLLIGQMVQMLNLPLNSNIYLKKEEYCIVSIIVQNDIVVLRDPNFAAFLKQYYNPHTHKLENIQGIIKVIITNIHQQLYLDQM
jgi:hypothetical protein